MQSVPGGKAGQIFLGLRTIPSPQTVPRRCPERSERPLPPSVDSDRGSESFDLMPMSPYERAEVVIATARDTKTYPFVLSVGNGSHHDVESN